MSRKVDEIKLDRKKRRSRSYMSRSANKFHNSYFRFHSFTFLNNNTFPNEERRDEILQKHILYIYFEIGITELSNMVVIANYLLFLPQQPAPSFRVSLDLPLFSLQQPDIQQAPAASFALKEINQRCQKCVTFRCNEYVYFQKEKKKKQCINGVVN